MMLNMCSTLIKRVRDNEKLFPIIVGGLPITKFWKRPANGEPYPETQGNPVGNFGEIV